MIIKAVPIVLKIIKICLVMHPNSILQWRLRMTENEKCECCEVEGGKLLICPMHRKRYIENSFLVKENND